MVESGCISMPLVLPIAKRYNPCMNTSNPDSVKNRYRLHAAGYDRTMRFAERIRTQAVRRLDLQPGESVLDIGCGTGLSFDMIQEGIGPEGRLIGVDLSADMLEIARDKVDQNGWTNVTLIEGDAFGIDLPEPPDAVLAFFVPEIMLSTPTIVRTLDSLAPNGRLVAAGVKHARGPLGPLFNLYFQARFRTWRWVGFRGAAKRIFARGQPYSALERAVERLDRRDFFLGCAYVARAVKQE